MKGIDQQAAGGDRSVFWAQEKKDRYITPQWKRKSPTNFRLKRRKKNHHSFSKGGGTSLLTGRGKGVR